MDWLFFGIGLFLGMIIGALSIKNKQIDDLVIIIKDHLKDISKDLDKNGYYSYTLSVCKGINDDEDDNNDDIEESPIVPCDVSRSYRNN